MADEDDDLAAEWAAALDEASDGGGDDDPFGEDIDMAAALAQQEQEEAAAPSRTSTTSGGMSIGDVIKSDQFEAIYDVEVNLRAVLGVSNMPMSQILKLGRGAVVELDRGVGDPIDLFSREQLIARGEVVVVEDRLAISIVDIVKSKRSR